MLKLTKKADYGLMALKYLAEHPETAALSAKDIADAYGIPAQLLAKILQQLTKSGLLKSHAGMNGGYALSKAGAVDFGLRGNSGNRWAVFYYLVHKRRQGMRPDAELHDQRTTGAGE